VNVLIMSERGQYLSIRYTERRVAASIDASVRSRGDAYYNALAESIIGLYKTEVIRHAGPWRCLDDVEHDARLGRLIQHVPLAGTARLPTPGGGRIDSACVSTAAQTVERLTDGSGESLSHEGRGQVRRSSKRISRSVPEQ
jgi:transposase InsO family protein